MRHHLRSPPRKLGRRWVGMDRWPKMPEVILERLEKSGLFTTDLESARQLGLLRQGDIHLEISPPARSDDNEETVPYLKLKTPIPKEPWEKLNTKQIRALLERAQGQGEKVVCGGCGRRAGKRLYGSRPHHAARGWRRE